MMLDNVTKRNFSKHAMYGPGAAITDHTDVASQALDVQGASGAGVIIVTGILTGEDVSNTLVPALQESDTLVAGDFTAVAAVDVVGGALLGAVGDNQVYKVGYLGTKRYIRVNLDFTGTGISSAYVTVIGMLENNYLVPGTDPSPQTAV